MKDPYQVDPQRLSEKPLVLEGTFKPGELERLEDALANGEGELHYRITAALDRRRRKTLSCIIEGFVFLTCQVSLEAFRHDVSISDRLVLVDREEELPPIGEESDAEDYLVADEPLDIRDLVEDAVLLSLPMVPRKPGLEDTVGGNEAVSRVTPFAALAGLKRKQ
jgi:uncharacterized protein